MTMLGKWDESVLPKSADAVDECVYGSNLLGSDQSLVLHGGGNTSVKTPYRDITGRDIDALFIKGSGWDLATIERQGFAALPIARLVELLQLEALSDRDMMRELSAARFDPAMPQPSVEALLHAFLPYRAVQHSHADLILTLTNTPNGERYVRELFGDRILIVRYVMPGFDLARELYSKWKTDSTSKTIGIVLMNHGLITFGDTTREAYLQHISIIKEAKEFLDRIAPIPVTQKDGSQQKPLSATLLAGIRKEISVYAGRPMIVQRENDELITKFVNRPDLKTIATKGPLTPDHVIRTKRIPLLGRDLADYVDKYSQYFERHRSRSSLQISMLDTAPRIVLDPEFGMLTIGQSTKDVKIASDIFRHTIVVASRCQDYLGGWEALPEESIFDVEYWELEQAKLLTTTSPLTFEGQVALVTGAASGIGEACAKALLRRGAAVIAIDRSNNVLNKSNNPNWHGVVADVTDSDSMGHAISLGVEAFGGVDVAVIAAGIFGQTTRISDLKSEDWRMVMSINTDAVADLLSQLYPLLKLSPVAGRVVIIGSKNVAAPGLGAAAYSASKAATTQLARVAALEWAADGIRINTVHPDSVFDTSLWTEELLLERANSYGLTVSEYKRRNLLGYEITSDHVGNLVAEICGPTFIATTGAQISIDGGNERTL